MDLFPPTQFLPGFAHQLMPSLAFSIPSGQTDSSLITCGGGSLVGVFIPAVFTGTSISFKASVDNVTFVPVHSLIAGTLLSYTVSPSTYCAIDPKDFHGINFLKIVSGSSEGALRSLFAALKGF